MTKLLWNAYLLGKIHTERRAPTVAGICIWAFLTLVIGGRQATRRRVALSVIGSYRI